MLRIVHMISFLLSFLFIFTSILSADLLYESLKTPWGVRAMGLGQAYTAIAEGPSAIFYNPAGLSLPGGAYHYENLDLEKSEAFKYSAHSLYLSPFSFSFWQKETSKGHVMVTAYGYGRQGTYGVDWGINYKSVREKYETYEKTGWSSDFGVLIKLFDYLNLGFVAKDILVQNLNLPTTFAAGVSLFTFDRHLNFSTDLVLDRSDSGRSIRSGFGAEAILTDGLSLRSGLMGDRFSGGVQLELPFGLLDWTVNIPLKDNKDMQVMIGFTLGQGVERKRVGRQYTLFKHDAYAEFRINNNLKEGRSEISLLGGYRIGANDLLSLIHYANLDPTCKGYLIRVGQLSSSISAVGLIQEVRKELIEAKKKGKYVVVYLESWATFPEYYLASAASKIVMPELGMISHLGLEMEVVKTKSLISNFGFESVLISSGEHKTSLHPNSPDISESSRLVLESVVDNLYQQVIEDIKKARSIRWENVGDIFDGRLISARDAKEKGLIDELGYWDVVKKEISEKSKLSESSAIINISHFSQPRTMPTIFSSRNRIAVIEVDGEIQMGSSQTNFLFGGTSTGAEDILSRVESISLDSTVVGVILRINSPGGSLIASDRIYHSLSKLKDKGKLVYASMGNIATSGGYYIALNTDKIYSNPGTLTGSVGVMSVYKNKETLNSILGIEHSVIKTGKYMDMFKGNRVLTKDEKKMLQEFQDEQYEVFVDKLKQQRSLSSEEAAEIAQGQIFSGTDAHKLKMVDELGHFFDVVDDLAMELKIKDPELVFYRDSPNTILSFLGGFFSNFIK